jgi:MFS family permease
VAVAAITITGITTNTLIGPAIPELLDEFGAPDAAAGLVIAAGSLPGIVIAPMIGFLSDRFGRREVIVPCLVLFAVAGGLGGLAPSIGWLVAARALQGAGSAGLINLAITVIGDGLAGPDRARAIGRNSALLTVAIAVLPFVGGVLTDLGGWRAVFAVYPFALVTAVTVWRLLPAGRRRRVDVAAQFADVRPALAQPAYIATALATVVSFALIFTFLLTVLPVYVERVFALSPTLRGVVLGLPAIGSTTGALLTGRLTDRWGRRNVLGASALLYAAGLLVLAALTSLPGVVAGIIVFGLGQGLSIASLQDAAAGAGTDEQRGTLVASQVGMARLGQSLGPLALAPLVGPLGYATTYLVGAALAAGPLLLAGRRTPPSRADSPT